VQRGLQGDNDNQSRYLINYAPMLDTLSLPFVQRGLVEVLLLAPAAGLLGTWIVLRSQAFFVHAAGTATFPGLVVADGLGFAAPLGALGAAGLLALTVTVLGRRRPGEQDALVAVALVGFLAAGAILASDAFESGAQVESLLFGSLLLIGASDLVLAGCCSAAVLVLSLVLGERWLARGFDSEGADAIGVRSPVPTLVLLGLLAVAAVAALDAVGGLLVSALFVVPAATTRLFCRRLVTWRIASVALVAVEGVAGLWLSVETNAPPGAAIALLAGAVFVAVAAAKSLRPLLSRPLAPATAAVAMTLVFAGCGSSDDSSGPKVVTTTTQLADITRVLAGPDADVVGILHANTDPHEYEPRPQDIRDTADAKLVITSGDGLDDWMDKVVDEAGGDPTVLDAGAGAPEQVPGDEGSVDPHWWHDPRNVEVAVGRIRDALIRAGVGRAHRVRDNAAAYDARLHALDRGIARCFAAVPASQRKLVTDHDAFNYFARRYGIQVVGAVIPAQSTQAQASAGDLARLSKTIRREHVRAVFPESSVNPRVARAIAAQTGASADHTLYGDTLGTKGSAGATYLTMEQANADAMMRGFTGGSRGCRVGGIA
jgi:ABC-type Zn uptake system ZnuABC Zn-binding protein ZnuA/ABC-type Mn2+/Zn2+ transport system permease subunit